MEYGPVEATLDRVQGDNLWLTLGLREGKNREVKRILEHLGLYVNRLIRLSFGPFQLGDLEVGLVEEVRTRSSRISSASLSPSRRASTSKARCASRSRLSVPPQSRRAPKARKPASGRIVVPPRGRPPQRVSTGGSAPACAAPCGVRRE